MTFSCKPEHVSKMVDYKVIEPLCSLLSVEDTDIVQMVLETVFNILENAGDQLEKISREIDECEGLNKIKQLQVAYLWTFFLL